jgi:uncharacterized protein YjbJ (UPF0337 family)
VTGVSVSPSGPAGRWRGLRTAVRRTDTNKEAHPLGAFEEVKGKVKEAVGDLTDNEALEQEGKAQKEKGEAEREADQARVEAKAHEVKADAKEAQQDLAEKAK